MKNISNSPKIHIGVVTYYNNRKHFGFIEDEDNNSRYFFIDIVQSKAKNKELKQLKQTKIKTKFHEGDEVNYKLRLVNDKEEVYDIEYIRNTKRQSILNEAIEKQILLGYLKQIDDKFFVKHIPTYIFIPLKILPVEIDIEEIYSQRINQIIQFKLERTEEIDRLSAYLVDRKFDYRYDELKRAYYNDEPVTGQIVRKVKGGMIVEIYGIETFLPASQIDIKSIRDYSLYIGQSMEFKIIKINVDLANVVVSRRVIIESQLEEQRKQIIPKLEIGQIFKGTVKNIKKYGAFIDLGGVDGLIHISDLSYERVTNIEDIISLGQKIDVVILNFDNDKKHIALGFKQLMDTNN
jgi:ribosomal protein S1